MYCPHCGRDVAEDQNFCGNCGTRLAATATAGIAPDQERTQTPWESRETVGFFPGLFRTVKQAMFSPARFFRTMRVSGGYADPLLFALLAGMGGFIALSSWDILLSGVDRAFQAPDLRTGTLGVSGALAGAIATPLLLIGLLFFAAAFLHLVLSAVRGAAAGYEATFRVVCYGLSPCVLLAVPVFGAPVALIWTLTVITIGLREAHHTTRGKALFAVLFPFLVVCAFLVLALALFLGAVAASFGGMLQDYR